MKISKDELLEIIKRHGKWLRGEDGGRANLSGANLYRADLSSANLTRADLTYAVGGNSRIQCLQINPYKIIVLDGSIAWGGCTKKTVQEWMDYSGDELDEKDKKYLETITKPFIQMCIGG